MPPDTVAPPDGDPRDKRRLVLLLASAWAAVLLFLLLVWPSLYRYPGDSDRFRVHRLTGNAQVYDKKAGEWRPAKRGRNNRDTWGDPHDRRGRRSMSPRPLLIEIGCEEIPARMIAPAALELGRRVAEILDRAGLGHGALTARGGARRLAVRVEGVAPRQADRDEILLGPPAAIAFDADGRPSAAALGFARRHGLGPERLERIENDRGAYAGAAVRVPGRAEDVVPRARARGVHPGYALGRDYPGLEDVLLVCLTEKRTPDDIDRLVEVLAEVAP